MPYPGQELKKLLKKIGITASPNCSCNQRAKFMDMQGVEWCEDNIDTIVEWLKEEAEKRKLPFIQFAAKILVKKAIYNAKKKRNNMNNKIFVQIASYRDPQLIPTIDDMIAKAKNPENLTFGICWQYDETEDINRYDNDARFKIDKYHYTQSEGLGWARAKTNALYSGEDYTLQIDSHHRFVQDWDVIVLEDFNQALKMSEKPIITTYCAPFDPNQPPETWHKAPCLMSQYEFSKDKLLMSMPYFIQNYQDKTEIIRARTISGHFYFTFGSFISDVPYDPDIYFGGYTEETTLSLRAFTHGYDFFSPYRTVMWHEYTRHYRVKHWDDHDKNSLTKKNSGERDVYARNKTRQLFGNEQHNIDMGAYELGKVRSLHDYEVYGGFDFKRCLIQDYTLKVKEPPNPPDWENNFTVTNYAIDVEWDKVFFEKQNLTNPKFLTIGILDSTYQEIFRTDLTMDKYSDYILMKKNKYRVNFKSSTTPKHLVMYLYDEQKGWSERYQINI